MRAHLQSKEARLPAAEWTRGEGQGPDCGAHGHYSELVTLPDKHDHKGYTI